MPRKSAKGTKGICKAPIPDGGICNKEFIRNKDRASDHKYCSDRCRRRKHRAMKKKRIAKEEKDRLTVLKTAEKLKDPVNNLKSLYNLFEKKATFIIEQIDTPVRQVIGVPDYSLPMDNVRNFLAAQETAKNAENERIKRLFNRHDHLHQAFLYFSEYYNKYQHFKREIKDKKTIIRINTIDQSAKILFDKLRLNDYITNSFKI